jgi:cytochrome P450
MLSVVVHAELPGLDPPRLTDEELHLFFSLLFAAGSDTTRNSIAGAILAMAQFPDQLELVRDERAVLGTAVEEVVRWTHPATYNRRTATRNTILAGQSISAGEKVVFWEASANRDANVFAEPMQFRVTRDPNPHVGFGHGIHHCLGASLARLEIRVVLEELFERIDAIHLAGPVEWARSNKHTGLRHLPLTLVPRRTR